MKCDSCDKILTDAEDAQRFTKSGARVGLCRKCVVWIPADIAITGSVNLAPELDQEFPEEEELIPLSNNLISSDDGQEQ